MSDSINTTVFQLDGNYNMINELHIPCYGKFINLQLNEVLVLVSDGYIDSYKLNQGQWQLIDSLATLVTSPMRINFLEDKLVVAWIKTINDQAFTFFQRNDTSWHQIDETILSFLGSTSALAWNGNDTLIAFTQILVKNGGNWQMQSIISGGTNVRNAAFLNENSFITSEFNQDKPAVIYSRANSSDLWTPVTSVVDNLQRPNVDPFFQFFVTGDRVVLLSLDASNPPVRVFIDEIAERCTLQNTVITCAMDLDTCQDVIIADYFTINRPCALAIDPEPYPIRLQNVSGKITAGSFDFTSADGFKFSCDAVIQCPPSSSNSQRKCI